MSVSFNVIFISETKYKKGDDSSNTNSCVSTDTRTSASTLSSSSKGDSGMAKFMLWHEGFETGC
jgi:hypothetical protein